MILSLDIATQTGWAVGSPCSQPIYGTLKLEGQRVGTRCLQLAREIGALIDEYHVTDVAIEEAFVGRKLTGKGLMTLFGYRAAAHMAAENKGITPTMVRPSEARKHFIQMGSLKRKEAKKHVMHQCQRIGWNPKNEDEADALALWDYRCFMLDRNHCNIGLFRT